MAAAVPETRPPCFYVTAGNVAHNRGDRGNLLAQLDLIRGRFPAARILVESYAAERDRAWYPAEFVPIRYGTLLGRRQLAGLRQADVVVWGGGALLADNSCRALAPFWATKLALIKALTGKPIMAWAHGVVLQTELGIWSARRALRAAEVVTVRDDTSLEHVRRAFDGPVHRTADPALLVVPGERATGERVLRDAGVDPQQPLILFSPTFWHLQHASDDLLPYPLGLRRVRRRKEVERCVLACAALMAELAAKSSAQVLLLPRYAHARWEDVEWLAQVEALCGDRRRVRLFRDDAVAPRDYLAMFRVARLGLSMAMHDAVFALAAGIPAVHLHYEPKGLELFRAAGLSDATVPWTTMHDDAGRQQIVGMVLEALRTADQRVARQERGLVPLRERARANVEHLARLWETHRA